MKSVTAEGPARALASWVLLAACASPSPAIATRPDAGGWDYRHRASGVVRGGALHLTSTAPNTAYQFSPLRPYLGDACALEPACFAYTGDDSRLLPEHSLGRAPRNGALEPLSLSAAARPSRAERQVTSYEASAQPRCQRIVSQHAALQVAPKTQPATTSLG